VLKRASKASSDQVQGSREHIIA